MKKFFLPILGVLACVAAVLVPGKWILPYADAQTVRAVVPVPGDVVRGFDPPDQPWLAGHRGVDLSSYPSQRVVAAMDGVVSFAGMVAGRPVISINHGDLTTTYEPVRATVSVGDVVVASSPIGVVIAGHPCPVEACLHWGLKQGDTYLDPLSLLAASRSRLISAEEMEQIRVRAAEVAAHASSTLLAPVDGVVTSAYGMRIHPISGAWTFHDGLDLGVACGTPIHAAAAGVVTQSFYHSGYGNRLVVDDGTLDGHSLTTAYNHAQGYAVSVGDQIYQGQILGWVGSTGDSTGCHLHFQTWVDSELTDPQTLLP